MSLKIDELQNLAIILSNLKYNTDNIQKILTPEILDKIKKLNISKIDDIEKKIKSLETLSNIVIENTNNIKNLSLITDNNKNNIDEINKKIIEVEKNNLKNKLKNNDIENTNNNILYKQNINISDIKFIKENIGNKIDNYKNLLQIINNKYIYNNYIYPSIKDDKYFFITSINYNIKYLFLLTLKVDILENYIINNKKIGFLKIEQIDEDNNIKKSYEEEILYENNNLIYINIYSFNIIKNNKSNKIVYYVNKVDNDNIKVEIQNHNILEYFLIEI